jgi:hypothetical protein
MKSLQHKRGTAAILTANNPTLLAGEYGIETDTGKVKIGDGSTAWTNLGYAFSNAANLTSGTLPDARLSSAIATYSTLATAANQPASGLDVYPRGEASQGSSGGTSGQIFWIFFTPTVSFTVSSITFCSGTIAGSGLTLARMGLTRTTRRPSRWWQGRRPTPHYSRQLTPPIRGA